MFNFRGCISFNLGGMRDEIFLGGKKAEHFSDWKGSICVVAYCRVVE